MNSTQTDVSSVYFFELDNTQNSVPQIQIF